MEILIKRDRENRPCEIRQPEELNFSKVLNHLDALWDLLSLSIECPIHLVWKNSSESKKKLGKQFEEIVSILERVRLENEKYGWKDKFTYSLE